MIAEFSIPEPGRVLWIEETKRVTMFGWLKSQLFKHTALSGLRAVRRLEPSVQRAIASEVAAFINLASVGSIALLREFLIASCQDRHDTERGRARSRSDPAWAAALKESWCGAKLGKARGTLSVAAADRVIREIEKFVFDPRHWL